MNESIYAWLEGFKRALPICLGYLPVGFAFGVLATKNGIPPALAVAMSCVQFSGSGQFVFASLWGNGAGYAATAIAVGIVNLRYLLMSAAEAPWMNGVNRVKRFFLGWGVTDESFVSHAAALKNGWRLNTVTMFVCNQTTQLAWVGGSAIGAFCGALVDDVRPLGLDYAITAMFIALLIPQCGSRRHLIVAIFTAALSIALKCSGLGQWNIALAAIAGATLGLCLSRIREEDAKRDPA
ncbi:MAG: AzlC family ABC transporter permease [Desulfovibrio sp.]|nr:AzlC family ABC transporter permease [Desulfovibrio sp.]